MKETYAAASDEELAARARQGDAAAETLLLEKYKPLVRSRARELFLAGGDREDLIQEGMLGLLKAVRSYDPKREASFGTYARLVVSRQIYSALAAAQRQKHQALNHSVSMEEIEEQQDRLALGTSDSPEAILLDLENARELREMIFAALSPMEKKVLALYLEGYDYLQIAARMERPVKSIDNALQRIRGKVARMVFQ
ncbi:MAG: sigma-70 family RNA polymerase sigma factor [Eubacterium sp.]|nr:sigma-70 family RNA polymerase sigma factor [Eubacterium sp.]